MLGAIAGDVIGSVHEFVATKTTDFELFVERSRFTDDTVLAVAVADCLLHGLDYVDTFHAYGKAYPAAGYGLRFHQWLLNGDALPYNSFGNGSAMRVPAVGYAFDSLEPCWRRPLAARRSPIVIPRASRVRKPRPLPSSWPARGRRRLRSRNWVERDMRLRPGRHARRSRPHYVFDETCQGTVPAALIAFLESRTSRTRCAKPVRSAGTPTPWPASPAASPRRTTAACPSPSCRATIERLDPRLFAVVVASTAVRSSIAGLEPVARNHEAHPGGRSKIARRP